MKRDAVDFHSVPEAHARLHARLEDWAYWVKPARARGATSPMFRLYRSDEHREGTAAPRVLNVLDCQKLEQAVAALPAKHGEAIRWSYVVKCSPVKACRAIACTLVELALLVDDGRTMLVNRRV